MHGSKKSEIVQKRLQNEYQSLEGTVQTRRLKMKQSM